MARTRDETRDPDQTCAIVALAALWDDRVEAAAEIVNHMTPAGRTKMRNTLDRLKTLGREVEEQGSRTN
jgi:hypothetical protein